MPRLTPLAAAWNTLTPEDDGLLEKGVEDVNAGQSHRAGYLAQSFPTPARLWKKPNEPILE